MHVFFLLMNTGHTLFNTFDNRAILSFRNDTVTEFNNLLIQKLQGNIHISHGPLMRYVLG